MMAFAPAFLALTSTTWPLSVWLRTVPLARYGPRYYILDRGDFLPGTPSPQWQKAPVQRVLELSAGRRALWSCAVAKVERPSIEFTVTDLKASDQVECTCVESVEADNARLIDFANTRSHQYDLIFAAHALCTCRCVGSPIEFARACHGAHPAALDSAGRSVARTCGGVPLAAEAVDGFVRAIAILLRPGAGIAIFDQEAGWPFGLERRLRDSAKSHGLHFTVRRGPLWTNTNYVLSAEPLVDDVSLDVLQRSAR